MLVDLSNELFVINVTSTNNNHVVSKIVGWVELSQMISSKILSVISISFSWLTHHVFSVNVEMSVFNGGLEISVIVFFMLLWDFFLNKFQFIIIKSAIAKSITKNFNCFVNITLEYLEGEVTDLSTSSIFLNSA